MFSGDTNGEGTDLVHLAKDADLFIAHNAVREGATGVERRLHMPPSVIAQIAQEAHVKRLVLSHRMLRTLGKEKRAPQKSERAFRAPSHSPTISIAFPYRNGVQRSAFGVWRLAFAGAVKWKYGYGLISRIERLQTR